MKISIVIPARNEERHIGRCLDAIDRAAARAASAIERIVVLNRCTDRTAEIARGGDARLVHNDSRNLAIIRNAGAREASGEVLVTIDADSIMSEDTLLEIEKALHGGRVIGGGITITPERTSLGIRMTFLPLRLFFRLTGLAAGLYWCRRRDFEAIGGFNEALSVGEDLDFAWRLKRHGRKSGLKFITLPRAAITTSCRKFDHYGDWFAFKTALFASGDILRGLRGKPCRFADHYFYDFKNNEGHEKAERET